MIPRALLLKASLVLAVLALVALPFVGCGLSTSGTATDAPGAACATDVQCDDGNPCTINTCNGASGTCAVQNAADADSPSQIAGDCEKNACRAGVEVVLEDATDFVDDKNDCTVDACVGGVSTSTPAADGASCNEGSAEGVCQGGECVIDCVSDAECDDGNLCTVGTCNLSLSKCEFADLDGVPTPTVTPVAGDCRVSLCIAGVDTSVVDDADLPFTTTDCDLELCDSGTPSNPPLDAGSACNGGGDVCDGASVCVQCLGTDDCNELPPDDACQTRTCINNQCGQTFQPANTVVGSGQTTGDCMVIVCDGAGNTGPIVDNADLPDDFNPCTADTCTNGAPANTNLAQNTSCGGVQICDGNGQCVGCVVASDCQGVDDQCKTRTCVNSVCGYNYQSNGTVLGMGQATGDCKELQCDGAGNTITVNKNTDLPVDNIQCTQDICTSGTPSNPAFGINTACTQNNGFFCNGAGACVECNSLSQCGVPPLCKDATCNANQCGLANSVVGTPTPGQIAGDCKLQVCDGNGGLQQNTDGGDLPVDNITCTQDVCTGQAPSNPPQALNFPCAQNGGTLCDGAGVCKQANGTVCATATVCVSGNCSDLFCCNTACAGGCDACAAASGASANGTCTVLTSGATGSGCGTYLCAGAATCPSMCATDANCVSTAYCNGTTCTAKKAQGTSCTASNQCSSGNCVDGFCCNTACGGACDACSIATGASVNGTCAILSASSAGSPSCTPYVCNGTVATCPSTCSADANCASGNYCNVTVCTAKKAQGTSCTAGNQCTSGNCVDGFCCNSACSGACDACSIAAGGAVNGTCANVSAGSTGAPSCTPYVCSGAAASCPSTCAADANCATGNYCNVNVCTAKKAQGQICTASNQCSSGNCVDGFCCNTACSGSCDACSVATGAAVNGTCGIVAASSAGSPTCSPYVCNGTLASCPATCTADANCASGNYCNGTTCVAKKAQGAMCVTGNECSNGNCADGFCCNAACNGNCNVCSMALGASANGLCEAVAGYVGNASCAPYLCTSASALCPNSCTKDSECSAGNYCNGSTCVPLLGLGATCATSNQCATAGCVDNVCCGSASCALCQSCGLANTEGTCTTLVAYDEDDDPVGQCIAPMACKGTSGAGSCLAANGAPCLMNGDCVSNVCDSGGADICKGAVGTPCAAAQDCQSNNCGGSFLCQ